MAQERLADFIGGPSPKASRSIPTGSEPMPTTDQSTKVLSDHEFALTHELDAARSLQAAGRPSAHGLTMAKAERIINKTHRWSAGLFLLAIIPAGYASFTGNPESPSPLVYLPLPFLFALILTGTYQLVLPWVRRRKARSAGAPSS